MPADLSPIERFNWRKLKLGELIINGFVTVDDDGNCTFLSGTKTDVLENVELINPTDGLSDDILSVSSREISSDDVANHGEVHTQRLSTKQSASKRTIKTDKKSSKQTAQSENEFIRSLPRPVMDALRRLFPSGKNCHVVSGCI